MLATNLATNFLEKQVSLELDTQSDIASSRTSLFFLFQREREIICEQKENRKRRNPNTPLEWGIVDIFAALALALVAKLTLFLIVYMSESGLKT